MKLLKINAAFADNLQKLPSIETVQRIDLLDDVGNIAGSIENIAGQKGSLAVYQYLHQIFGRLDANAAEHGVEIFAEHSDDAKNRPGAHPNIDRLFAIIAGGIPLSVQILAIG